MHQIATHFQHIDPRRLGQAQSIFEDVCGGLLVDDWHPEGSMIATYHNYVRIGFAARKQNCSLHFQGTEAVQLYQELNGDCPTGAVTIKLPYKRTWNLATVRHTLGIILSRSA